MKNTSIEQVLDEIESQSEFYFIFNQKQIDVNRIVDIQVDNLLITDILSGLFGETNVNYAVFDRKILLTTDPIENELQAISSENEPQQKQVTGTVTDKSGSPLPGANVIVTGTTQGVITDFAGKYSIEIPQGAKSLTFSFIGMEPQEIIIGTSTQLNVTLDVSAIGLDEVVVIGYGTQKRIEVTSSVANVKSENFIKGSVKDAGQLLQGKVAGLTVSTISGDPTAPSQLVLRGTATLSTSTQPLILIDGIPGDLNTVAPEDIESVDVLKDGSASAIYGTRGTNGVILLTTKKPFGKIESTVTYEGYVSTQNFVRVPKMLDAAEYRLRLSEGIAFTDLGASTDWVKEISRDFPLNQNHRLSFHGGNAKTNYLASFNYRQLQGVVLRSDYKTLNSRIDVNHIMLDDKLKFNLNIIDNDNQSWVDFGYRRRFSRLRIFQCFQSGIIQESDCAP